MLFNQHCPRWNNVTDAQWSETDNLLATAHIVCSHTLPINRYQNRGSLWITDKAQKCLAPLGSVYKLNSATLFKNLHLITTKNFESTPVSSSLSFSAALHKMKSPNCPMFPLRNCSTYFTKICSSKFKFRPYRSNMTPIYMWHISNDIDFLKRKL
jgi:hypothetical protein